MKVYMVHEEDGEYSDWRYNVCGIFATFEEAVNYIKSIKIPCCRDSNGWWYNLSEPHADKEVVEIGFANNVTITDEPMPWGNENATFYARIESPGYGTADDIAFFVTEYELGIAFFVTEYELGMGADIDSSSWPYSLSFSFKE